MEVFECMQCGAQLEIDSKGEMDGRCVICPYCRSEIVFRECRNRHTSLKKNET